LGAFAWTERAMSSKRPSQLSSKIFERMYSFGH
jgi:hypothetical protein